MSVKVASTQFDLRRLATGAGFWERVEHLAARAAEQGARVLLLPEYFSLAWLLAENSQEFAAALDGFAPLAEQFHHRFSVVSTQYQMAVVAGTVPVRENGRRFNRSFIYLPDGRQFFQDKRNMTRFEDERWSMTSGGNEVSVFEWQGVRWGVAVCYDIEFPEYVRELVKKDVDVILVPSCTDDVHGYWRVRHCSAARAIESQSYIVMSSIVGGDAAHPEIDAHYGAAGFFTPCDAGFTEGGVLLTGTLNKEEVHVVELDFEKLERVRVNGTVLNRLQGQFT